MNQGGRYSRGLFVGVWLALGVFGVSLRAQEPARLRVLTFNTWLLKPVSKFYEERLSLLPKEIARTQADLVALQEVWNNHDRDWIAQQLRELGYFVEFREDRDEGVSLPLKGMLGNGLLIASKYPIIFGPHQLIFSDRTRMDEFFVNKGAIHVVVEIPGIGPVDFFNAHLGAVTHRSRSNDEKPIELKNHRRQALEMADFIRGFSREAVAIVAMDLNSHPFDRSLLTRVAHPEFEVFEYQMLTSQLGLRDPFREFNEQEAMRGCTYDQCNGFVSSGRFRNDPSETLDYILVTANQNFLKPMASRLAMDQPVEPLGRVLSDHYGVMTDFEISSDSLIER